MPIMPYMIGISWKRLEPPEGYGKAPVIFEGDANSLITDISL